MSKGNKGGGGFSFRTAMIQMPLMVRESESGEAVNIRTPEDIAGVCEDLRGLAQECFQVLCLNAKNQVLDRILVSLGLVDASLVHPREVFRGAIVAGACALVLVHNHPSGDPTPSAEDVRVTRQLVQAGEILDIKVLDHVVIGQTGVGGPGWYSMRENGFKF